MIDDFLPSLIRCPVTGEGLRRRLSRPGEFFAMRSVGFEMPVGPTRLVMVTTDGQHAFPVVSGVPVLLAPERLSTKPAEESGIDVSKPPYVETYAENSLYASLAIQRNSDPLIERLRTSFSLADPATFPEPPERWHGGGSTASAYATALRHLAPVADCVVLQIGGIGTHAMKLLHAGARQAIVISPVIEELIQGVSLAEALGFTDRMTFVGGIAEQLPLAAGCIDRIYSGSSMHHTVTTDSFRGVVRVLAPGGRFASVDVWRAGKLYDFGIRIFGKRHANTHCVAFSPSRVEPATAAFERTAVTFHGAISRYALALGERVGRQASPARAQRLTDWEDRVAARLPRLTRRTASIVLIRGSA